MAYANTTTPLFDSQAPAAGASAAAGYKSANTANAKHRIVTIEYAVPSSALPAAGDTVKLTKLDVGARVLAGLSSIICEDPGTTLTGHVGDWSNPKRYTASAVLSAASSTVGSGLIGFGLTPGIGAELFVPMKVKGLPIPSVPFVAPPAWVTGTTYNIGDRVTQTSLTYVCLIKHVAGVHATDLTALKWVLSGSYQPWVTGTSYTIGDAVIIGGAYYICIVAHTASAAFATDAADWVAVTPDETEVIFQCASISTLTAGKKITFFLAVVDE